MKTILYYTTVIGKKKIKGYRTEYGIGAWWLIILIKICERLADYFLKSKIYLERFVKKEKGKLEKW